VWRCRGIFLGGGDGYYGKAVGHDIGGDSD